MARLVVQIYDAPDFDWKNYRWIYQDLGNLGRIEFNERVSSIKVFKGASYQPGDKVRFFTETGYIGGFLELGPGNYPDIRIQPYSFDNRISSVRFLPVDEEPIAGLIRLKITIYDKKDYAGKFRQIPYSLKNLGHQKFNERIGSLRIVRGPNYAPGYVANFFTETKFSGGMLPPGDFDAGTEIPDLSVAPYKLDNVISSIEIAKSL